MTYPSHREDDRVPRDLQEKLRELIRQDRSIQAVKVLREATGWDLKRAKDYVDAMR